MTALDIESEVVEVGLLLTRQQIVHLEQVATDEGQTLGQFLRGLVLDCLTRSPRQRWGARSLPSQ